MTLAELFHTIMHTDLTGFFNTLGAIAVLWIAAGVFIGLLILADRRNKP